MQYQLLFPFASHPASLRAPGILTAERFLKEHYSGAEGVRRLKEEEGFSAECTRLEDLLRSTRGTTQDFLHRMHDDIEEDATPHLGTLHLLPGADQYHVENFLPVHWRKDVTMIQTEGRRVYAMTAKKLDGSSQKIMIKGEKFGMMCSCRPDKEWITGISSIYVHKDAKDDADTLQRLAKKGVPVERPLAYFKHGQEQYIYTEFVDGSDPTKALRSTERSRVWRSDATLLAGLCEEGIYHQGFYSKEFDDKIWTGNDLVLIDVDESWDMRSNAWFKEGLLDTKKRKEFCEGWLKDCVSSYLFHNMLRPDEVKPYVRAFSKQMEWPMSENLLKGIDPTRQTWDSYVSMMCDCD